MYIKRIKIRQIIKSLEDGNQIHASCQLAGTSPMTLWRWSHKSARFSKFWHLRLETLLYSAKESSEKKRVAIVESAHFKKLKDGTARATDYIFYLCNRDPARWKNVKDAAVSLDQSNHLHVMSVRNEALSEMSDNDLRSALDGIVNRRHTSVSSG